MRCGYQPQGPKSLTIGTGQGVHALIRIQATCLVRPASTGSRGSYRVVRPQPWWRKGQLNDIRDFGGLC
jgi:hypothetical protein